MVMDDGVTTAAEAVVDGVAATGRPPGRQGQELLDTARTAFLQHGFDGTTMQHVATTAGISKSSLYAEHASKDDLFIAVVTDWAGRGRGAMQPHLDALVAEPDVQVGLSDFCALLLEAVLSRPVLRMRRLVTAQADRFPEVARLYLEASWQANIRALADSLSRLDAAGRLVVDDPLVAADQLVWLTVGGPMNAQAIAGEDHATVDEGDHVAAAVATFLARHGA